MRERESVCVCVCECVRVTEKQREREGGGGGKTGKNWQIKQRKKSLNTLFYKIQCKPQALYKIDLFVFQ